MKTIASAVVMLSLLSIYQATTSLAARSRSGDYINLVADRARQLSDDTHRPIVFIDVAKTPIQALLGNNDMVADSSVAQADNGAALIISERAWLKFADQFAGRAHILIHTPKLPESETTMLLIRIDSR